MTDKQQESMGVGLNAKVNENIVLSSSSQSMQSCDVSMTNGVNNPSYGSVTADSIPELKSLNLGPKFRILSQTRLVYHNKCYLYSTCSEYT